MATDKDSTAMNGGNEPAKPLHLIGYARVSMSDQTNRRQIDELLKFGVDEEDIYTDEASGRNMNRPGWKACWKDLRAGDLLVVHSIDRLGRDLLEVIRVVRELHEKGADLKILATDLDTRSITGRMVFSVLVSIAQWERELIVERTKSGLLAARARGIVGGSKPKISDDQVREARHRVQHGEPPAAVAKSYKISRQTLYKRIKELRERPDAE